MPLFGGARDISLLRTFNRELINDIIQQEVGFYKFVLPDSNVNVYGESENKIYYDFIMSEDEKINKPKQQFTPDDPEYYLTEEGLLKKEF